MSAMVKTPSRGHIGDYVGDYYGAHKGILGVETIAHVNVRARNQKNEIILLYIHTQTP